MRFEVGKYFIEIIWFHPFLLEKREGDNNTERGSEGGERVRREICDNVCNTFVWFLVVV